MVMDPYYEQRLRDEVIYLHSLWHQGPPRNPINPVPANPTAQPSFAPLRCSLSSPNTSGCGKKSSNPLHVSNPTSFKRESGFKGSKKGMAGKDGTLTAAPVPSDGGSEWPVPKATVEPSPSCSEWASAKPVASRILPTAEEAARQAVVRMQYRVLDSFSEFLARKAGSDSDDAAEDDVVPEGSVLEESEEYKFLLGVFMSDKELRDYYEKNCAGGDFCCFVCGGDKKSGKKKFKSCEGLLQHSISIAKTNQRRAHRALGLVICKVLGWDIDRLPVIVVKGEPLGRTLASSGDIQCESERNVEREELDRKHKHDEISVLEDSVPSSGSGWPCQEVSKDPNTTMREWPNLRPCSLNPPVSAEEEERIAAEQKVLGACRDFFRSKYVSEYDVDENEEEGDGMMDEDEEDDGDDYDDEESEEYMFFIKLFTEDAKLRTYYEKSCGDGDFLCLACAGVLKKIWRRFGGCIALLNHSNTVRNTKRKAHRAYTRAVCKVLGWDVGQLPKIVRVAEPLSSSLVEMQGSVPLPASDAQWPCQEIKDGSDQVRTEWPNPELPSNSVSAEEQERAATEQKILESCRDLFRQKYGIEYDEDAEAGDLMDEEEEDEEEEDGDEDELTNGEYEEFEFFVKLFMENANLRSYYQSRHGDGDFLCLVCGAAKKKTWRRFKGCIGLLHHSNTIWKTKKKAHRSYARAVCKVLGWDIDRLPRIVSISEPLGQSGAGTQVALTMQSSVALPASGAEWPCQDPLDVPDSQVSNWPDPDRAPEPISAEEKDKLAANQKVLEACRGFFHDKYGIDLDEDEDDEEEEDSMDEDGGADVVEEGGDVACRDHYEKSDEFKFFVKLFTEDDKLRGFYENNHAGGDFCCLVCATVRKKTWKRFKGCGGLLGHSNTVLETKKKAHRAYARAVCQVLGWDIKQLPRIVKTADHLSRSLAKPDDVLGQVNVLDPQEAPWPLMS